MGGVPIVDLFAGAGGLSLGATAAGGDVRALVDNDPIACATLRANARRHGGEVLERDVQALAGGELRDLAGVSPADPLIVIGGAPCQPFSKAAYWLEPGDEARYREARSQGLRPRRPAPLSDARPDERRSLVGEFWRCVREARADAFVFENVPSILHPRNRPTLDALMRSARGAGFRLTLSKVNAVDYGVPQKRERVILLGCRGARLPVAQRTHGARSDSLKAFLTAGRALRPFGGSGFFEAEEIVSGRWERHLREVPPGWNYKAHTAWGGHPRPTFVAERRFWNFLLKLSPDLPSWTLPANPGPWTGPFHWDDRRLRTVEMAALQSFPRGYRFEGARRDRVRQIGNAVPPLLARRLMAPVVGALEGRDNLKEAS